MNYREQQLRLILKQHQNKWEKERDILQHDIWTLENSTDLKLLNQAQDKQKELQEALDSIVKILGQEEIKNLTDLRNLLKGKTLKELITNWEKKYQTLAEEKDEEIETQIIKQTELEALRKDQQKELKKEIDTQQKELIARTREIWDLEKKQEKTLKQLKETQEQLTNKDNQLKEQKGTDTLYQQKINDLDNQLINLAKQKIKNQKEAQALLNRLEANWKSEKEGWKNDKQELLKSWKQERDKQAQSLAQERKDFYGQIEKLQQVNQELTTNLTEKEKTITDQLNINKDLDQSELVRNQNLVSELQTKLTEAQKDTLTPEEKKILEELDKFFKEFINEIEFGQLSEWKMLQDYKKKSPNDFEEKQYPHLHVCLNFIYEILTEFIAGEVILGRIKAHDK